MSALVVLWLIIILHLKQNFFIFSSIRALEMQMSVCLIWSANKKMIFFSKKILKRRTFFEWSDQLNNSQKHTYPIWNANITMLMFHFIMDRFNKAANNYFFSCFIITMLTIKRNSFVQRSHMWEKFAFLFRLMVTMLTTISNSFMQRMHMSEKVTFYYLALWSHCSQL